VTPCLNTPPATKKVSNNVTDILPARSLYWNPFENIISLFKCAELGMERIGTLHNELRQILDFLIRILVLLF
jgi:hypothetical protein